MMRIKRLTQFVSYMNQLRFKASWGLSALEGIVKGNEDEMKDSYIPSYVYYGVDNNPALAMRMLGIPRSFVIILIANNYRLYLRLLIYKIA